MNKQLLLVGLICVICLPGLAQVSLFSGKIRQSRQNSFYSYDHYRKDNLLPEKPGKGIQPSIPAGFPKRITNSPNDIIENLENPPNTIVLDGNKELRELRELMNDPKQILIEGNYAEIPFEKGSTLYRIPFNLETKHHLLTDPLVKNELNQYIKECVSATNVVPASIVLNHNNMTAGCEFLSFKSVSNLYSKPYYLQRLNLSCVFNEKWLKDFNCYANQSKKGYLVF